MKKVSLNQKGFGLVGALIALAVLVVLGGAGAYVYHRDHKTKPTTSNDNQSTQTTSNNSTQTNNNNNSSASTTKTDPYAGWKTYTDTTYHYSFKYPTDWTATVGSAQGQSVSVRNPGNSVLVAYENPFIKAGGTGSFYAADVEDASSSTSLKIVGGAFAANNLPSYWVINGSMLKTYPLAVGQTSTFETAARFTDQGSANDAQLTAYPIGTVFTSTDQAKTWFASADAKTALLILESLAYRQ
jgi:hypothetical protein